MSEMWCWPHEFVQPEMLMRIAADLGEAGLVEGPADVVGEAAGLRDGEVAGVGTGAGDDVAGELGAGLGHADLGEAVVEVGGARSSVRSRSAKFWRLVMRTSSVEVALDVRRAPGTARW